MLPGPWGPTVIGRLPDGTQVSFRARRHGRESEEYLTLESGDGLTREFCVNCTHASGIGYVQIRHLTNPQTLYVESDGRVVATIDMTKDEFYQEGVSPPQWVPSREASTIAEGRVRPWFLIDLLWPL